MGVQPSSTIGARLREARNNKGMTQQKVADILGVTRSVISKYESEINDPSTDNVRVMAEAYGVSPNFIYGKDEAEHDPKPSFDWTIILRQPNRNEAWIIAHHLKRKYQVPQEEFSRWEDEIYKTYGDIEELPIDTAPAAEGPKTPGSGIFSEEDEDA